MTFFDQQVEIKSDSRQNYPEFRSKQRILGENVIFLQVQKSQVVPRKMSFFQNVNLKPSP